MQNAKITIGALRLQQLITARCVAQRFQTNIAASQKDATTTTQIDDAKVEWQNAREFAEIPKITMYSMLRGFMPGGKYYKLGWTDMISAMKHDYGNIFYWPGMFGKPSFVMTHNPTDFEHVFRSEGIWPHRPDNEIIKYFRGTYRKDFFQGIDGTLSTQGEQWGTIRSAVNPVLMQPKNVQLYLPRMSKVNVEFVEHIKSIRDPNTFEVPANFEEDINRWTLESVSIVALDKQLGLLSHNRNDARIMQFFKDMVEFFKINFELEFQPSIWKYVATPKFKRAMQLLDNFKELTHFYVDEAIERLEQEAKQGIERAEHEKGVLEKLLKIDKKIATVMAMDMLLAGVDTTTSTFVGLLLCLGKNAAKQNKLREEICQILPQKDSEFTEQSYKHMPYLRACIKESMRMYPLIVGNARVTQNDTVLSGYRVPKGTGVVMFSTTLLRDEKYFAQPDEFIPERWLRADKQQATTDNCPQAALKTNNPFVLLPFGFGARSCVGKRIAELELELGAARIIRNFNVEFDYPTKNAFKSLLINVPNIPLKFKFTDV